MLEINNYNIIIWHSEDANYYNTIEQNLKVASKRRFLNVLGMYTIFQSLIK